MNARLVMIGFAAALVAASAGRAAAEPAEPAEPATFGATARCTLGAIYAKTGDLPRAALLLDDCDDIAFAPDVGAAIARAQHETRRALEAGQLSEISIITEPAGVAIETDALPGEPLVAPVTLWARAGTYKVAAGGVAQTIQVGAHGRTSVLLDARAPAAAVVHDHQMDFTDETLEPAQTGSPPPIKHPSLLPCQYTGCNTHSGEELADPLAVTEAPLPVDPPALELGARAGTSAAFHDGTNRVAPAFAIDGRIRAGALPHVGAAAIDIRVDWSRRSGQMNGQSGDFDELGASAQYGAVIARPAAAWLAWFVGVRGELRMSIPAGISRTELGATTALELALRALPVTLGVRYDDDLAHDHALLVELGVSLRKP